jgi:putative phosphoesterase
MKDIKVGIVSDTHGVIDTRILQTLHHCDYIVHAGDIMAGSVLQALRAITPNVIAVAGNNDVQDVLMSRSTGRCESVDVQDVLMSRSPGRGESDKECGRARS